MGDDLARDRAIVIPSTERGVHADVSRAGFHEPLERTDALVGRTDGHHLIQSLLVASTGLVVALATGQDGTRGIAELRALLDLAERLCPESGVDDLASARSALDRVMP